MVKFLNLTEIQDFMDKAYRKLLEKQHYNFIGEHTAVKICGWTKKSLRGEGVCYKEKFYGIKSHRCAQMSPAINICNQACMHCWRDRNNSDFDSVDDVAAIVDGLAKGQQVLLSGFGGYAGLDLQKFKEAQEPMHIAISLSGEPTLYPKLSLLIERFMSSGKSVFVVTNGTKPEVLKSMCMPTQLYVSLEAYNSEKYKELCMQDENYWSSILESLDVLKSLKDKTRTSLRVTCIKDFNMDNPKGFAELLERADATFVEVKAYMHVGESRERLSIENMPRHEEVKEFSLKVAESCGYKLIDEHAPSRVVLLMKEDFDSRIMKF